MKAFGGYFYPGCCSNTLPVPAPIVARVPAPGHAHRCTEYTTGRCHCDIVESDVYLSGTELDTDVQNGSISNCNSNNSRPASGYKGFSNPFFNEPREAFSGHLARLAVPIADRNQLCYAFTNNLSKAPEYISAHLESIRESLPPARIRDYKPTVTSPSKFMERLTPDASSPKMPIEVPSPSASRSQYRRKRSFFKKDSLVNIFLSPTGALTTPIFTGSHTMSLGQGRHASFSSSPVPPQFTPYHSCRPFSSGPQGEQDKADMEAELLACSRSVVGIQRSRMSLSPDAPKSSNVHHDREEWYGGSDKENPAPVVVSALAAPLGDSQEGMDYPHDTHAVGGMANDAQASRCGCRGYVHSASCRLYEDPRYECPCHYEHYVLQGESCPLLSDPISTDCFYNDKIVDEGNERDLGGEVSGNGKGHEGKLKRAEIKPGLSMDKKDYGVPEDDLVFEVRSMRSRSSEYMTGRCMAKRKGFKLRGGKLQEVELRSSSI